MGHAERRGILYMLIAVSGYAFLPIFGEMIYQVADLQATDIAFWRFIFATPVIWLLIALRERKNPFSRHGKDSRRQTLRLLALGIIYAISAVAAFGSLKYISASLFVVLFYTYPAMVALISLMLGVRLRLLAWVALALTLIGIILTVPDIDLSGSSDLLLGIIIALINALSVAIYFILSGRVMRGSKSVAYGTAWIITGTLASLIIILPFFGLTIPDSIEAWLLLFALATISTAMPIFTLNLGIQALGVTKAAIFSTAEPAMTMVLAVILLTETILPVQWLGAAFIIAGVLILELRPRRKVITPVQ